MTSFPLHVVIISWGSLDPAAAAIAKAMAPVADRLTVLHSASVAGPAESSADRPGHWITLPENAFFGPKFATALAETAADAGMLLIHADTSFDDWPGLVARCRWAFANWPDLGVWGPDFTNTPWRTDWVRLLNMPGHPEVVSVAQTDGIIFALAPAVLNRLRQLDLSGNNLGWGIDWAAIGFSLATGRLVLRDLSLVVQHPASRGYMSDLALDQMRSILAALPLAEQTQVLLLMEFCEKRQGAGRPLAQKLWKTAFGRKRRPLSSLFD